MQANVTIDRRAALREIKQKIDSVSFDYGVASVTALVATDFLAQF